MPYTAKKALVTLGAYTGWNMDQLQTIEGTDGRGYIIQLPSGVNAVIFVYPLVHLQKGTKNYFDTRDSAPDKRGITWRYAIENNLKYFCLGVNDTVPKYVDYIFSLECCEEMIEEVSGTKNGERNGKGNQIIIPNTFIPSKPFERLRNDRGVYISAVHKKYLIDYLECYDNRQYMEVDRALKFARETSLKNRESVNYKTGVSSPFGYNRIIFGAPGTGKSFQLEQERKLFLGESSSSNYERVTFHPDYSYANFVGTYKPVPSIDEDGNDAITYEYVPGPFMRLYTRALESALSDKPEPFILIIEEINRANTAAVFGDVFQLLDRDETGVSEYPIQTSEDMRKYLSDHLGGTPEDYFEMRLPDNMSIWATMNSADQGVFPMDTAFKRRWDFTYLGIDDNEKELIGKTVVLGSIKRQRVEWNKLRKAINHFLASQNINEDKQLGPYFIARSIVIPEEGNEINRDKFIETFKNKVLMYLFEDAAKQKQSKLFEGCFNSSKRFSEICREFDEKGIGIFNAEIQHLAEPEDLPDGDTDGTTQEV